MSLLMFHKWTAFVVGGFNGDIKTTERCAPSILITFINMILFKDNEPDSPECDAYMYAGHQDNRAMRSLNSHQDNRA